MKFKRLNTEEEVRELINYHNKNSDFLVIDVETTSKNPREAELIDVQISGKTEEEAVIFSKDFAASLYCLDMGVILVAHNYKYDAHVLFRHGILLLDRTWRDTLLLGHLVDENRKSYSLDSYVKEYWNDPYKEEFWKKYKTYEESKEEDRLEYACKDIIYTNLLYRRLREDLLQQRLSDSLIEHVHRLQASLLKTEIEGIKIDLEYLTDIGVRIRTKLNEIEPKMRGCVKDEVETIELEAWEKKLSLLKTDKGRANVKRPSFNFESSAQLSSLLYGHLGLDVQRNEKTKAISTDFASLERIKAAHPVVGLIQEHRELNKVYGTYIQGTLDREDHGRIYPEFRVAGTVTGRLSHSNPNLAQLPKSGGVRGIYVPDSERVFIAADYSQLEVIIEANLTNDKSLVCMLENGESKHDYTARELGCDRHTAKTLNFALQYHASHFKVAKLLGISDVEGQNVWRKYWNIYAGVKDLKLRTDKMVNEGIPIETVFGRKRRFAPGKRNPWSSDYRQAYNFLIQSTGADITSMAFYDISDYLELQESGRALFTVHDEILIEVEKEEAELCDLVLQHCMTAVGKFIKFKIPLQVTSSGAMFRWEDK